MGPRTGAQGSFAVKDFYKNGDSFVIAQREFRREFGVHCNRAVPSAQAIRTWVQNSEDTGSTLKKKGGSIKTARTPENVAAVREAIERSPRRSARRHATSLGLSEASVRRILHKDLHFCPYKIQITHALHEHGYENSRFLPDFSAIEIYERPLLGSKVTVLGAISSFGITGPYFFEDEWKRAVTRPRYVHMLDSLLAPALSRLPVKEERFFLQDGATCHTARASMAAVNNLFPNHVISRYGDIIWPARAPHLSTCHFFFRGVSEIPYFQISSTLHTVQELKHRIREEVEMLQRVMSDFRKRLTERLQRNGGHLSDVIFGK
ncbi:hypothetical protein B7P43_G04273 [Cryptotermes secundus]|uniref:DUF4817 domain-containing protein n=1 Tax=Cryptotermes secundus TaxID=105785 RepID=A0A2J7PWC1_9NEOP|nr:hypothetical protein B7P43_G04273 [Cryptotermes secundus]